MNLSFERRFSRLLNRTFNPVPDRKGASLLETIVAMGLVGGLAITLAQQGTQLFKVEADSHATGDYLELSDQISQVLSDSHFCGQVFSKSVGTSAPAPTPSQSSSPSSMIGGALTVQDGNLPVIGAKGTSISLNQILDLEGGALVQVNKRYKNLAVLKIELSPLTAELQADPAGLTLSQYSKLTLTVAQYTNLANTLEMAFPLTTIKNKSDGLMASCTNPQPWTGSVLGQNLQCAADSALSWDGVGFYCRKVLCPNGTIQMGTSSDGKGDANCVPYPNCSPGGVGMPTQSLVFINGAFVCKGLVCPTGYFASRLDSDGFTQECKTSFASLLEGGH